MRILAAITEPSVAQRILACLGLPPRAPPLAPASPQLDVGSTLDRPDPRDDEDFDQTAPGEWDLGA